jgi:hypothetical protein
MKTSRIINSLVLLTGFLILFSGCKKEKDDPVPVFTITADTVRFEGGQKGLQFFATCTNTDVTLNNVLAKNPELINYAYSPNTAYGKNNSIPLQAVNTGYPYQSGTWKFNLSGKTTSAGEVFSIDLTYTAAIIPTSLNTSTPLNNAFAEAAFDNATQWSDQAMAGHSLKTTLTDTVYMGTCVLATLDMTSLPYSLVIDFGETNCLCDDQHYRHGKIIVQFNGNYWAANTVITYTFENYFIDNNEIQGTKTVTNKGRNTSNNLWWETVVSGTVIKANNGGTFTWNSTRQHEWTSGETTPFVWWDDVYMITGTANGTGTDGKTYSINITSPLMKKLNCEWLESGILNIQIQGLPAITLDYGNGTCDNLATATVNGQTYIITLD